jgi:ATP-binding cassette subfamily B protein
MATQQEASISLRSFACNGGVIFVVGETGSGKSTLLKLIAQKLPGYKGSMTWDGREISDFERSKLSGQVLFMDSAITFSDTIEENIRLGADMDNVRMNEALRSADFDSYVENKPDNIAHIIKEADLSSGENQRLSIARIFYHSHRHFILDEVLSAIDAGSQLKIMSELRSLAAQRQSVLMLATHNLTLVRDDDSVIFVASDGSCTFGEHRSLLAGSKPYSAFCEREMP